MEASKRWDSYGFLSTDETPNGDVSVKHSQHHRGWDIYMEQIVDRRQIIRSRTLQKLVRNGIPGDLRSKIWPALVDLNGMRRKFPDGHYEELVKRQVASDTSSIAQEEIDKDLRRTFPGHRMFESIDGLAALRRVLVSYSIHNPRVGYCQSLNFLVGMLLLYVNEEEAFWFLDVILRQILPDSYYTQSMQNCLTDQMCLHHLSDLSHADNATEALVILQKSALKYADADDLIRIAFTDPKCRVKEFHLSKLRKMYEPHVPSVVPGQASATAQSQLTETERRQEEPPEKPQKPKAESRGSFFARWRLTSAADACVATNEVGGADGAPCHPAPVLSANAAMANFYTAPSYYTEIKDVAGMLDSELNECYMSASSPSMPHVSETRSCVGEVPHPTMGDKPQSKQRAEECRADDEGMDESMDSEDENELEMLRFEQRTRMARSYFVQIRMDEQGDRGKHIKGFQGALYFQKRSRRHTCQANSIRLAPLKQDLPRLCRIISESEAAGMPYSSLSLDGVNG
eukprot:764054-Hanusia_phi.AAC.7